MLFGAFAVVAVLGYLALRPKRAGSVSQPVSPEPARSGAVAPPPPPPPASSSSSSLGDLATGGGLAIAAAAGALAGGWLQGFHPSENKVSGAAAPAIGAAAGAGSFLAFSGVLVAGAPPLTLVIVPALVITAAILSTINAIESQSRFSRFRELSKSIDEAIARRDFWAAWKVAEDAYVKEGIQGLGFRSNIHAETVPSTTGQSLRVKEQMLWAYSLEPSEKGGARLNFDQARARGDAWADALEQAQPWLTKGALRSRYRPLTQEEAVNRARQAQRVQDDVPKRVSPNPELRIPPNLPESAPDYKRRPNVPGQRF